jgi:hypothetical protein
MEKYLRVMLTELPHGKTYQQLDEGVEEEQSLMAIPRDMRMYEKMSMGGGERMQVILVEMEIQLMHVLLTIIKPVPIEKGIPIHHVLMENQGRFVPR